LEKGLCVEVVYEKEALWCSRRRAGETEEFEAAAGICGGANRGNSYK
jgi:hypothetical protein